MPAEGRAERGRGSSNSYPRERGSPAMGRRRRRGLREHVDRRGPLPKRAVSSWATPEMAGPLVLEATPGLGVRTHPRSPDTSLLVATQESRTASA